MRKKIIFVTILLIPLTLIVVYFARINFAKNISITFNNISTQDFSKINFYGISPLNRILYFYKAENVKNFSSLGNKAFLNKIYLFLPDSVHRKILSINLSVGENVFNINDENFSDFFKPSLKEKHLFILSENITRTSVIDIFYAVFSWEDKVKIPLFSGVLVIILILFAWFLSKNLMLKKNKILLNNKLKNLKIALKKIISNSFIFKLYAVFSIFLWTIFFIIMHYNIYCGFSGYVFLLLLYTTFYLTTYIFKKSTSKNTLVNIRLTLTSIFFILIVCEFFLRFFNVNSSYLERNTLCYQRVFKKYNNSRYYTRIPLEDVYYTTSEFTYQRKVYANGFTQPMLNREKKQNEFRILALGDSFTEGVGVNSDSTWINLLNKKLSSYYPDTYLNSFNAGVVSSDPVFQYVLLTEKFNTFNFDMVIVAINESDITDIVLRGGFERFQDNGSVVYKALPSWEWLYGLSYIFRLVVINGLDYNHILIKDDEFEKRKTEALKIIYETIVKFYKYSKENNIELITVFHPSESEVCFPHFYRFSYLNELLNKKYADMHIIDLQKHYVNNLKMNLQNVNQYYWKIDGHHNGKGYNVFAEYICNYIIENKLIK